MIAGAPEAEVDEYVALFTDEVDGDRKRLVVRKAHGQTTGDSRFGDAADPDAASERQARRSGDPANVSGSA
jgi:hypothetical protein